MIWSRLKFRWSWRRSVVLDYQAPIYQSWPVETEEKQRKANLQWVEECREKLYPNQAGGPDLDEA